MFVPSMPNELAWGALGSSAASSSNTAGNTSYVTLMRRTASSAVVNVLRGHGRHPVTHEANVLVEDVLGFGHISGTGVTVEAQRAVVRDMRAVEEVGHRMHARQRFGLARINGEDASVGMWR